MERKAQEVQPGETAGELEAPEFLSPWVVWQAVVRWSLRGLFSDQLLVFIGVATVLVAPPAPPNLAREISVN